MSSRSVPIPAHRFAEAIRDLPLENLHIKAAELSNSIAHLELSNQQLQPFAEEDRDCADAINENKDVMEQMRNRISSLKLEVERRGFKLEDQERELNVEASNGCMQNDGDHHSSFQYDSNIHASIGLVNEEFASLPGEQIAEEGTEREEGGAHL